MSFNIDITLSPPTLADISAKREQAIDERAVYKKKNIVFTSTLLSIVVVYVTLVIKFVIPQLGDADPDWGMITYFFPYFTFAIFVIGNHLHIKKIEKPSKLLDKLIADLSEVTADEVNGVINDKEQVNEIVSYLEQVTAQGRSLVRLEIDAIQKWYDANKPAN